ncbi:hypothetical protein MCEMSE15_00562 [Fimbriimonadaceae bacterium]
MIALLLQDRILLTGEGFLYRIEKPRTLQSIKVKPAESPVMARFTNAAGEKFTIFTDAKSATPSAVERIIDARLEKIRKVTGGKIQSKGKRENLFREMAYLFQVVNPDESIVRLAFYDSPKVVTTFQAELQSAADPYPGLEDFELLYLSYGFVTDKIKKK